MKLTENVLHGNKEVEERGGITPVQEEDEEDLIRYVTMTTQGYLDNIFSSQIREILFLTDI